MALVNKWPASTEQMYDNKQWEAKNWSIGEPITKEKLQKMDDGIAILATQVKAILGEFNPSSLDGAQLNASRLDKVQEWITGSSSTTYSGTNIASRLSGIDTLNSAQNTRLTNIESVNTTQSNDISSLKTRATNLENRATAIETLNTAQNGRLDSVENKNTEQDGRLDSIDTLNASQNTEITNLKTRATSIESVNATQNTEITNLKTRATNIESVNTAQNNRLTALENELSGSGTGTTGSSRLDNIQTWIAGAANSEYSGTTIATRLNSLETSRTTDEAAIGTLQTDNTTNKTNISNIITKNNEQDNNISKIKIEVWGPNKSFDDSSRIDDLSDRTSTVESLSTSNQSRISTAESRIERIEGGAIAAKIFNYTTTNTTASDSLTLSANSLIDQNSIVMIFLNAATLGTNNLTIKDSTNIAYNIKINNQTNSNLKAKFAAGSLLGLYRGTSNEVYLFNAPLAI